MHCKHFELEFVYLLSGCYLHLVLKTFQAALSSAYIRIVNACPPCSWKPDRLIPLLSSPKPISHLINCFRVAISRLGPNVVGRIMTDQSSAGLSVAKENRSESRSVGGKRSIQDLEALETKRQKIDDCSGPKGHDVLKAVDCSTGIGEEDYADYMCSSLNLLLGFLEPPEDNTSPMGTKSSLTAICTFCIVFSEHPHAELSLRIFRQTFKWISWMSQQVLLFIFIFFI